MGRAIKALSDSNGLLSPKQEKLAFALAAGSSLQAAARSCGVGLTTAKRWLGELPLMVRRVGALRSEMTSEALGRLVDNMTSAADTLGYLSRKAKSPAIRLQASVKVIELGLKVREHVELDQRVTALEGG